MNWDEGIHMLFPNGIKDALEGIEHPDRYRWHIKDLDFEPPLIVGVFDELLQAMHCTLNSNHTVVYDTLIDVYVPW